MSSVAGMRASAPVAVARGDSDAGSDPAMGRGGGAESACPVSVGRGGCPVSVDGRGGGPNGDAMGPGLSPHCRDILRLLKY